MRVRLTAVPLARGRVGGREGGKGVWRGRGEEKRGRGGERAGSGGGGGGGRGGLTFRGWRGVVLPPHMIFPVLCATKVLLDFASAQKRHAALCTLWRLLRHTSPPLRSEHKLASSTELFKRRILLTLLSDLLNPKMGDSRSARLEILRALGVVGAIDPATLRAGNSCANSATAANATNSSTVNTNTTNTNPNVGGAGEKGGTSATTVMTAGGNLNTGITGCGTVLEGPTAHAPALLPIFDDALFLAAAAGGINAGFAGGGTGAAEDTPIAALGLGGAAGAASNPLYYPAVALAALTRILREPSLAAQHRAAVAPIVTVLGDLGAKSVPLLPAVLPLLLQVC